MNGGGERVEKALVRVRREIHGDMRGGRDGSGDFDIEFHFAVGAAGIAGGRIGCAVH